MNLLLRQIFALVRKNLLILCARRPVSTFIRAFAIPLIVVFVVAYCKNFFASDQTWGVGSPAVIRSLKDGLAASTDKSIVGFIDNDMKGGEVASVIESLSRTVQEAGKTPKQYGFVFDMERDCAAKSNGNSICYGAVEFFSSPKQSTNQSESGVWNYTIRGVIDSYADIRKHDHSSELQLLPLQRAVDQEIIARSQSDNTSALPPTVDEMIFTSRGQQFLSDSRTSNYLNLCIYIFGTVFSFAMVGIVYHLVSFVATERELGMSSLIDAMLPGGSAMKARLVRQISTYFAFALVYLPGWLVVGIVISTVVFPETSRGIPVGYHIFSGLAFCSFSLFGASFFKKSQLSGAIVVIVALVFAILPQVLFEQKKIQVYIFSLLFPSANYTYFITGLATWEASTGTPKVRLMEHAPDFALKDPWRVKLGIHWIFLGVQIVVYPTLAFFLEHILFSTTSTGHSFARPASPGAPTVTVSGFCKTYRPRVLGIFGTSKRDVHAVQNMDLVAYPGQILCLLGPNGSGKSTTLNCIAGQQKVTSGTITVDPTGGLGYAPQSNVIWPDLTVAEHIRIFSDLKCTTSVNAEIITELVKSCDLTEKLPARAKTLSGGQKRKLQLAMMFAGGSTVCCVDEVSTGLDPISRRRIWEILLAERSRRTFIMTTHFLDEADFLADNILIMYKGSLKAEGTSATLKHRFGNGYTIKLPDHIDLDLSLSGAVEKEASRHQMVYRVATAALAAELITQLERRQIHDYQVSGPTMEELFLKATGDNITTIEVTPKSGEDENSSEPHVVMPVHDSYDLADGRPISAFKQWWLLFLKRFRILRRRYMPYFFTIAVAIVGAAIAPKLIKSFKVPMSCPQPEDLFYWSLYQSDVGSSAQYSEWIMGPPDKLANESLAQIVDIYNSRRYTYPEYYGFGNVSSLQSQLTIANTYEEFTQFVGKQQQTPLDEIYASGYIRVRGGIWLGDKPTILFNVQDGATSLYMQNIMNVLYSKVPISVHFANFATTEMPEIYDFKPLMFTLYFGLIMACYPAFFALYPTNERISNVRSMQYSNGIRPLPLWLSHLAFDGIVILVISAVGTGLLSISTPVWIGLGYIFFIMFLYGITSALLSYIFSMFAKGAVTAWFMCALLQVIFYFAYFGALIGTQSTTGYPDLEKMNNAVYFGLAIISPVVSLERAFSIGLGQWALLCNGHPIGSVYLYGGPILYLILQGMVLFTILLWWDSSFTLPSFRSPKASGDPEGNQMYTSELIEETQRLKSTSTDLRVESVTKIFGKNLAVDNVTFAVQTSEIFALLGPNGAGKSTLISMIRGDMKPSTHVSNIQIAGHSVLSSPVAARANLGVCPQFDSADVLTVSETLRFFAKTRGVKNIDHNVTTVISACGLEAWADQLAQKLSGGTKRKLSLAVALVGNPRVLVLDEPSSALDANAKRKMWHTLQSISKGRAVVLTTHSMEEADALADRIGIVSSRMLAIGEREALKKRAGDAFHIHLVSRSAPRTSPEELAQMKQWIVDTYPDAKVSRETQGGQLRFEVPVEGHRLVDLIKALEAAKGDLGVEYYSVGKATLDEVFEKIVKRFGDGSHEK